MKQITLDIPDNKYTFFMELLKSLTFVKKVEVDAEPSKKQVLRDLRDAVEEVKLIKAGKLKGMQAKDLINEL